MTISDLELGSLTRGICEIVDATADVGSEGRTLYLGEMWEGVDSADLRSMRSFVVKHVTAKMLDFSTGARAVIRIEGIPHGLAS